MEKNILVDALLNEYAEALLATNQYTKNAIGTRKSKLKKVVEKREFNSIQDFKTLVISEGGFGELLNPFKGEDPKELSKLKNALNTYLRLVIGDESKYREEGIVNLLKDYAVLVDKITDIPGINTTNIIGEYGEMLISKHFNLERAETNQSIYDATFKDKQNGETYYVQVKTRWFREEKLNDETIEFGAINPNKIRKDNKVADHYFFVGLILNKCFNVLKCIVLNLNDYEDIVGNKKQVIRFNNNFENNHNKKLQQKLNNIEVNSIYEDSVL